MKKYLVCSVVLLFLLSFSYANATLLGLNAGTRPDILVNTGATIDYTESTDLFVYLASDRTITYSDGSLDYLSGPGFKTKFTLQGYVDAAGNWTGGIAGPDMIEQVIEGTVSIKGVNYGVGTILLAGDVKAFGWDNVGPSQIPKFDFLIDKNTLTGALTTQVAPPDLPWSTAYDTGIIATGEGTSIIDWTKDLHFTEMKGDKFPTVPEPTTIILLGCGLVGLAGFAWQRKRKQS
jgi:hypothetical protein